jgi:hypothetical protein
MLSAQKEDTRLQVAPSTPNTPTPGGFGKVLNSIEGLQQRLDDVSLEDIAAATENAKILTLRLSELQRKLADLTTMQESIVAVRRAVDEAADENSKLTRLEAVDRPLHFQAIVQASNLIRFPRIVKPAKENPRSSRTVVATDVPVSIAPPEISLVSQKPVELAQSRIEEKNLATPRAEPAFLQEYKIVAEETAAVEARVIASSPVDQGDRSQEHTPELTATDFDASQTQSLHDGPDHEAPSHVAESDFLVVEPTPPVSEKDIIENGTTISPAASADFDQRLLNDLIKNYGEFAASADLPAPLKPRTESATKVPGQHKHAESKAPEHEAVKNTVPSLKKQGELDRQLKKLIKDYGEYDLYRQHSPINLKTGVIAAFLLLGIIFSGFYFFSTRQAANPSPNAVTTISTPDGKSPAAGADTGEVLSRESAATVESRQTGEESPRGAPNNPSLKRNK